MGCREDVYFVQLQPNDPETVFLAEQIQVVIAEPDSVSDDCDSYITKLNQFEMDEDFVYDTGLIHPCEFHDKVRSANWPEGTYTIIALTFRTVDERLQPISEGCKENASFDVSHTIFLRETGIFGTKVAGNREPGIDSLEDLCAQR